jgi:hypothetical protein
MLLIRSELDLNDTKTMTPSHPFQSMLADRPARVEVQVEVGTRRSFMIRAADSHRERRSASGLVERMYMARGYETAPAHGEGSSHRKTFLASEHNVPIGTLTIGTDSDEGLTVEGTFAREVAQFRAAGLRICEFTKLAMDRCARSPRLLAALFHVAYIYAHRIKDLTHLVIEVNPRHVRYYETMLGFTVIGAPRHNARVNAQAVLLSLDLSYAREQIAIFGGRPGMAATERSAYPHFFSAIDEAGIASRLLNSGEVLAHVFDSAPRRPPAASATEALH